MKDMTDPDKQLTPAGDKAIRHLKQAITSGQHWYIALLEAIGLWDIAGEPHNGRTYCYLIDGEAFDWLLLAERLCEAVGSLVPEDEKAALLFYARPPVDLPAEKVKKLMGSVKYHQYLNYFYGIIAEEALVLAVQEEVRKEWWVSGYYREKDTANEAYGRIYGTTKAVLLRQFRQDRNYPQLNSTNLTELKEFTYWLFKHRLKQSDKAKVASDTRKALDWLKNKGFPRRTDRRDFELAFIDILPSEPTN